MEKRHFILLDFHGTLVGMGEATAAGKGEVTLTWTADLGDEDLRFSSMGEVLAQPNVANFSWTEGCLSDPGSHRGTFRGLFRDGVLFRGWQDLTRVEAAIWGRLWRAQGEWVSHDSLYNLMEMLAISPKSLRVHIQNIRKKLALKGITIENSIKEGYRVVQKGA